MNTAEMSVQEKKTRITLYKKDSASYALILLAAAAEFVYVVNVLDAMPVSFWTGITVMVNIFLLFMLFTCAVKVSAYHKRWTLVSICAGVYMLLRQFILVPLVLKPVERETVILLANVIGAVLLLFAGYVSLGKIARRDRIRQ